MTSWTVIINQPRPELFFTPTWGGDRCHWRNGGDHRGILKTKTIKVYLGWQFEANNIFWGSFPGKKFGVYLGKKVGANLWSKKWGLFRSKTEDLFQNFWKKNCEGMIFRQILERQNGGDQRVFGQKCRNGIPRHHTISTTSQEISRFGRPWHATSIPTTATPKAISKSHFLKYHLSQERHRLDTPAKTAPFLGPTNNKCVHNIKTMRSSHTIVTNLELI